MTSPGLGLAGTRYGRWLTMGLCLCSAPLALVACDDSSAPSNEAGELRPPELLPPTLGTEPAQLESTQLEPTPVAEPSLEDTGKLVEVGRLAEGETPLGDVPDGFRLRAVPAQVFGTSADLELVALTAAQSPSPASRPWVLGRRLVSGRVLNRSATTTYCALDIAVSLGLDRQPAWSKVALFHGSESTVEMRRCLKPGDTGVFHALLAKLGAPQPTLQQIERGAVAFSAVASESVPAPVSRLTTVGGLRHNGPASSAPPPLHVGQRILNVGQSLACVDVTSLSFWVVDTHGNLLALAFDDRKTQLWGLPLDIGEGYSAKAALPQVGPVSSTQLHLQLAWRDPDPKPSDPARPCRIELRQDSER